MTPPEHSCCTKEGTKAEKGNIELVFVQLQAPDQCFGHRASCPLDVRPVAQENGSEQPAPAEGRAPSA